MKKLLTLVFWLGFSVSALAQSQTTTSAPNYVMASGSITAGQLAYWSSITGSYQASGGNLSGDCTTTNTLAVICTKTNGTAFAPSATTDATNASNITSGTLSVNRFNNGTSASSSTYLNGAGNWTTPAGGGTGCTVPGTANSILYDTGTGCGDAGGTISSAGRHVFPASTTAQAFLNLPQGSAPTSPANGDVWVTSAGIYVQIAGATVGPLGASSSPGAYGAPLLYFPTNNGSYSVFGAVTSNALGTVTPAASHQYFMPFYVPQTTAFTQLAMIVTTAQASDSCSEGIYNSTTTSGALVPNVLLVSTSLSTAATGLISGSAAITLAANTTYWSSIICNSSSAVLRSVTGTNLSAIFGFSSSGSTPYSTYGLPGSGTTLPSPFTGGAAPGISISPAMIPIQ